MKLNHLIILFYFISFFFEGCGGTGNDKIYKSIISKNYKQFTGKSLYIRDFDLKGNAIIFYYDYKISYNPCGYLIFIADLNSGMILESKKKIFSDTCKLEAKKEDSSLIKQFVKLGFRRLMVDNKENIYISTKDPQHFNIVRVMTRTDTSTEYNGWRILNNNWLVKP